MLGLWLTIEQMFNPQQPRDLPRLPPTDNQSCKGLCCPRGTVQQCYASPPGSLNVLCECKPAPISAGPRPQQAPPPKPPMMSGPCDSGRGTWECRPDGSCYCKPRRVSAGPGINTLPQGSSTPYTCGCSTVDDWTRDPSRWWRREVFPLG